ncbi:MAG: hypothetical protein KF771_13925 [Burkholderiales bacterium]|nr:hypothetical protein [Burkholderiales bacterium]
MTRDQQITELRKLVSRRISGLLFWLCLAAAVCGLLLAWRVQGQGWFMGAVVLGIIAAVLRRVSVHQHDALAALDSARSEPASVEIDIEDTSESRRYYARVRMASGAVWRMEFVPLCWKPQAGTFAAEARFAPAVEWPALLLLEEGIFHPVYRPQVS